MASIYKVQRKGRQVWRAQVRLTTGTNLSQYFDTNAEARKWAAWVETQAQKGLRVEAQKLRFGELIDAYGQDHAGIMGRSKAAGIALIRRRMGKVRLPDLSKGQTYTSFVAERERDGAGPATILQDLSCLRTVLDGGATLLWLDVSQQLATLGGVRRMLRAQGRIAPAAERDRRPADGELLALRDHWLANPRQKIPMWDLVSFASATGMRLSEILALRWDDLDEAASMILIRDRKHPRAKRGNNQRVPLLDGLFRPGGDFVNPVELILRQPDRGPLIFPFKPNSVSAAFIRACAALGIRDLHFHDLRHHACSLMFEAGYQIQEVALVSGHRDWSMLRRYTNLRGEDLHRRPVEAPTPTPPPQSNVVHFPAAAR